MNTFFDTTKANKESFRKTEFLDLPQGQSIIRILSGPEEAHKYYTHFIKGTYVLCLGDDCPLCKNNTKLIMENPENFRDIPGWSPKQERYAVNVLDKTPVKICANCNAEVKKIGTNFPPMCPKCNQPILTVQETPLNKVKVLAKGVTLAELLNGINASILDSEGNPIGINNFDIILYVTGTGKSQSVTPIPLPDKNEPVNVPAEAKFDLKAVSLSLTADEIAELQKGVSVKDIFAARRAVTGKEPAAPETPQAIAQEVKDIVNGILK